MFHQSTSVVVLHHAISFRMAKQGRPGGLQYVLTNTRGDDVRVSSGYDEFQEVHLHTSTSVVPGIAGGDTTHDSLSVRI